MTQQNIMLPGNDNQFELKPGRAGVTLIELLTVLVIISIMVVGSTMAFNSFSRKSGLEGTASAVASTLSQARQYAITHRDTVKFCYANVTVPPDFKVSTYCVKDVYDNMISQTVTNPYGVMFDPASGEFTFNTDGSMSGSGGSTDAELLVKENIPGSGGESITISVNWMTGYVRVRKE